MLNKIIDWFKARLGINPPKCDDELDNICNMVRRVELCLKKAKNPNQIMELTLALRHCGLMRRIIGEMKRTDEPREFLAGYNDLLMLSDTMCGFDSLDRRAKQGLSELSVQLKALSTPPQISESQGLVYYSVSFMGGRREYYYLSGENKYSIGQYVIVPVHADMERKIARITDVTHFTPTNAPMPPESLKTIVDCAFRFRCKTHLQPR